MAVARRCLAFAQKASEAAQRHKSAVRQRHAKVVHLGVARRGSYHSTNRLGLRTGTRARKSARARRRVPLAEARTASATSQSHLAAAGRRGGNAESEALHSPARCARRRSPVKSRQQARSAGANAPEMHSRAHACGGGWLRGAGARNEDAGSGRCSAGALQRRARRQCRDKHIVGRASECKC